MGLFDLPRNVEYSAIHVRRGDKLAFEARGEVERFWRDLVHADPRNLPTEYVLYQHYLAQWDGLDAYPTNKGGQPTFVRHSVYVATDDPIAGRGEICPTASGRTP